MTNRQIDEAREKRLWIRDIIIPVVTTIGVGIAIPEVRKAVSNTCKSVKKNITKRIKKEKKERVIIEKGLDDNILKVENKLTGEYYIKRL